MAGFAAWSTPYSRCCPLVPVQRWSDELPATTVGERRRRRSLRRQGRTLHCPFNFLPQVLLQCGLEKCQAYEGQTVSGQSHVWGSRCCKSAIWRFKASCRLVTRMPVEGSDVAVAAGWQFHPLTRAHGCKEQRSGLTTQDRRAPPARATNPRTGGYRPKKRHFTTGIPAITFLYLKPDGFVSEVVPFASTSPSFWPRSVVCGAPLHVAFCVQRVDRTSDHVLVLVASEFDLLIKNARP